MRLLLLLSICFSLQAYDAIDYAKLNASKEAYKAEKKLHKVVKRSIAVSKYRNYIEIIHTNMKQLQIPQFTKKYELELYKCLAGNICIYKYNGALPLKKLMEKMKKDKTNIQAIYKYNRHDFVTF